MLLNESVDSENLTLQYMATLYEEEFNEDKRGMGCRGPTLVGIPNGILNLFLLHKNCGCTMLPLANVVGQ